ncbi:hypothetical protein SDC9_67724 [bioreactor metagenome]|uniref:Uncharacterized protein n=1 Tax=bioreactor metagenome TaxID=1076179 RepID=A0A644XYG8_9ZZZZ
MASPRLGTTTRLASASTPATSASVSTKASGRRNLSICFPPSPRCRSTARIGTFRMNAMAQPSRNGDTSPISALNAFSIGDRFCRHQYPASTANAASATVRTAFLSKFISSPYMGNQRASRGSSCRKPSRQNSPGTFHRISPGGSAPPLPDTPAPPPGCFRSQTASKAEPLWQDCPESWSRPVRPAFR